MSSPVDPAGAVTLLARAAIDSTDSSGCADLLGTTKRLRGWLDSIEARITSRVTELHAKCGGVSTAEGKRKDRRSKAIEDAPSFGDALAAGDVSAEHVDALANATARLDDDIKAAVLDHEDGLLADATRMSPENSGRSVRELARLLERDQGIERNQRQRGETFLSRRLNPSTGMVEGRFAFHPELGNQIFGSVDREVAAMIAEGVRRRDPDFVAGGHQHTLPTFVDVIVVIDGSTLTDGVHDDSVCETSDGAILPPESVRRLVCGGRTIPIVTDSDGNPFDMGREIRHANRAQRRALRAIYRTCAFGDCDIAFDRCEIHHLVPWELGGTTDLSNLVPICSRHHHVVHEGGWQLSLSPDRTVTITQPDGQVFTTCRPDMVVRRSGADRASESPAEHRQPAA